MTAWSDRAETLLAEATPGPWTVSRGGTFYACELRAPDPYNGFALVKVATNERADFDLIAASRELVPLLVNVAKAAEAESAEQYECILCTRSWPDGEPDHFAGCPLAALRDWGNETC